MEKSPVTKLINPYYYAKNCCYRVRGVQREYNTIAKKLVSSNNGLWMYDRIQGASDLYVKPGLLR